MELNIHEKFNATLKGMMARKAPKDEIQKLIDDYKAQKDATVKSPESKPKTEVKKDDFVSSIPGLKEKLVKTQETKTPEVSVSSPEKTTATKVEEPVAKTTEKIIKPHISYDQLTQSPVLPNIKIGDIQNLSKSDQQSTKELGQRANDKEFNMVKNLEEHYEGEGFTFSVQDEWGWNDIVAIKDKNGRSFKIDTNSRIYKKDPAKYLKRFHSWAEQSRKDDNVEPSTSDFYSIHNYPKLQELKTKLREVPSMSQEAADIDSEIKNIENAIAESKIEPNNKRHKNNKDIVDAHNKKVEEITNRVLNTAGDQGMSYTEALTEAKKQVKFWETNNPNKTTFDFANYEVNTINKGLEEISTYYEGDDYSAFDVESDEKTELHYLVERQIIEDLSLKEMGKAAAGGFNGADKEKIITNAKHEVLTSEYKKYEQISKSKVVLDFVNKRDNIFQRIEQSTNGIPNDDDGNLIFSTQKQADDYNNLVKSYQALEKEGEDIKNTLILAEEKFETIQAELAYNAVDGVFKNNFEVTDQYEEWRDNHIKNRGFWGETYDAAATFIQEGVNIAADATIGLGVSIAGFADIKLNGENKYYDGHDVVQDFYERYAKYNYLGVSDLNADILDKDGNYNWENGSRVVTKTIAEMLPFTIGIILAAGKGNPKPAKTLYNSLTSEKGRQTIRMMDASYRMTINDNFHEGKSLGLSDDQAFAFSNIKSFATGLSQAVMPDVNFLGSAPGRLILNGFIDNLKKATTKKAIGVAVKNFNVNFVKELGEEELELVGDLIAKHSVGLAHSPVILDLRTQKETIAATLMLSGSLGSVGAVSDYKAVKKQVYDQYRNKGQDIISLLDDNLKVAEGKLKNARTQESKNNHQATIDQINKAKDYGQSIINAINSAPENVSDDQIDLLIQKQNLVNQKQGKDKAISIGIDNQIKKIDEKISNSVIIQEEGKQAELRLIAVNKATATVKKQMASLEKETGVKGQVIEMSSLEIAETQAEQVALLEAEVEGYKEEISNLDPKSKEYKKIQKQLEDSENLLDGITNADTSYGYIVDYSDGSYDLILNTDKPMVGTAAHEFQHKVLARTLKNNSKLQNAFGDALIEYGNKLGGFSPAFIDRMSAYINPNTGKQISEFGEEVITVMSESILDGSLKFDESLFVKIGDIIRQTLQRAGIVDIKFDTGRDVYNFVKDYKRSIDKGYVSKAITKMAAEGAKGKLTETATDTKAGGTKFSKEASDEVQRIYDEKGNAGVFDIIEQFKPIVNKIVQKRSEAPGFDRELLTSEIEIGKRGILDLVREYDPKSGVPLAAFINKYLPARAIEASRRILGEEFMDDVDTMVNIASGEVSTETEVKPERKKVLLSDKLGVKNKVDNAVKAKLSTLDLENLNFKNLKDQTPEITGELFGIDPKKLISSANITKKELQSAQMFINKNADLLLSMLPDGATTGGTATGVPKTLLDAFYVKADRAKMAKTGSKAGLAIQVKKENISNKEFLEVFGIIDGKPVRDDRNTSARVLALANQTGKMMSNQAIRQLIENRGDVSKSILFNLQDGKASVMFSKSLPESKHDIYYDRYGNLVTSVSNSNNKNLESITNDVKGVYGDIFSDKEIKDISKETFNRVEKYGELLKKHGKVKMPYTLSEFLIDKAIGDNLDYGVKEMLNNLLPKDDNGKTIQIGNHYFDKNRIIKLRRVPVDLGIKLAEELGLPSAIEYMIKHYKGMYVGATRIADNRYLFKDGELVDNPKYNPLDPGKNRKQVFSSVNDFIENVIGKMGVNVYNTNGTIKTIKQLEKELGISTKLLAENSKSAIKDKNFEAREAQAIEARGAVIRMMDFVTKENGYDVVDLAMTVTSMGSGMTSVMRRAANLKYIGEGVENLKNPGKDAEYEHMIPQVEMTLKLLKAYLEGDTISDSMWEGYHVAVIPKGMNDVLTENGFRSKSPTTGNRYYNPDTFGDSRLVPIRSIDPKDNGRVMGADFIKAGNAIGDTAKELQAKGAITRAYMFSKSANPAKGISVLDFDDTLATTKSGVRYTLPNPDGTPQPKKKVVFMAGGPGSGKSNVINQLGLKEQGFKVVNQDISLEWLMKNHGMPTDMREFTPEQASEFGKLSAQAREIALKKRIKYQGEGDGVIIDGTGASLNVMKKNIQDFKDKGYDVQMIFVETSQETALSRNKARKERSLRTGIVIKTHDSVQANKEAYKELFGERFAEVNTDNLKQGDAMPADVVNKVNDFTSGYIKGRLNAGEYATKGEELKQQGAEFDFSEFNQVVEGKTAPLFNKAMKLQEKFTSKDMFVLTARPAESNQAIFEFLQANGLNIPIENIVGLGSSLSSDKALWMASKVGEGYNDFYFADDILENVQAVSDMLEQFDVKSKVQQAKRDFVIGDPKVTKLLNEKSMNDVKDVDGLANPGVYSNVKFSKSHRAEYENTVAKNRPDLSGKEVTATIDKMFEYIDGLDVPNKRKYEQITTKWLATSNIKLPEDSYKIQQAVEIAELKKEDIFSYKNPNEIIEKYAGTIKVKPISPVGIKEFTRATGINDPITTEYGIVEYEVEETREAQQKVRDIVNTHWGPNSNPWCITKIDKDGNLSEDAWRDWTSYGKGPKRIVFQNGKLLAMKANYEYWGKMNKHSEGPIIQVKEGNVTNTTELVVGDGGIVDPIIRETRTVSKDGNTVTTNIFENSQDGYADGTTIVENRIKGVKTKETRFDPDGSKVSTQEFNKKGKPTTSYQFNPNGKVKSINGHLQQQAITEAGLDVNAREDADIDLTNELVVRVGDIIENNYTETETDGTTTDYFYGRALVGDQVMEIGFESKTGLDLADVTKTIGGKTRLDIGKVIREVDPNVKGLPKTGVKFSKGISKEFNDIIEQSTGVGSEKVFSDAQAKIRGNKMRFDNIVPYSVQDLMGLLYNFVGKGKVGEQHMEFFKKALIDPFARAINELNQSKQSSAGDYRNLTKAFPNVKKKLNKEVESGDYTYDQAIRVYLWNKAGFEVPGLSKRDLNTLDSIVKNDPELQAFADTLGLISKKEEGYAKPGEHWLVENIASDLLSDGSIGDARSEFLAEWQQNADEMFSKENLNKIQAIYGNKFREALEDILYRMKYGTNRPTGSSRLTNNFMNWINNSTGAIMFFNMRSALLQTLSTTNYINWADNNPLQAAMAFANQKQYWSDFSALFNSDFLKQRRSGNQRSINEAELTTAVANSDNKAKAALAWLLQKGFLPTQIMDSFAISAGGATFYRNRINKYIKEGMTKEEAQEKAFLDFQEITEATQQSARPDMISQQQASPLGRLILSFQNTPMQYARIMNKAARDIVNGRGDQKSNISKIVYYGALQSIIFAALQSAIFASLGDDEEEEFDKKKQRIVGSMVDGWLAGLGVAGKAIGTIERSIKEYLKQKERGFNADHAQTIIQLLGFSPPIGSKLRKIYSAIQTEEFNKGVSEKRGFTLDNPTWSSWGNVIEGFTNIPLGRISNKLLNIDNALDSQNQWWERAALLLGWNTWDLGIKDPDIIAVKGEIKEERKVEKKEEALIKKEEKKNEVEEENISKEKANIELQKKEIEDGNKSPDCAAINKRGERCGTKIEKGSTYCTVHTKVEQNDSGKKTQCRKTKKDGKRCKMQTSNKSGYCYYHD
jgi:predicted kinase